MSTFTDSLEALTKVHALDVELAAMRARLASVCEEMDAAATRIRNHEERLAQLRESEKELQQRQTLREKDMTQAEALARDMLRRRGKAADAAEYLGFTQKMEVARTEAAEHESLALELLEEVEEIGVEVATEVRRLEVERRNSERALEPRRAEQAQLESAISDLEERRRAAAVPVDNSLLSRYERLRRGGGPGLARAAGKHCSSCNNALTLQDLNALVSRKIAVTCRECGSLLAVDQDEINALTGKKNKPD